MLGVLPFVEDLWMDAEDSLALEARAPEAPALADTLDVVVLRLRWMSNFTDLDALSAPSPACACASRARRRTSSAPTSS